MTTRSRPIALAALAAWLCAGCATPPDVQADREAVEADIEEILSLTRDNPDYGGPERCLSDIRIQSYRALSDEYLLFEGLGDKQWINKLRGTCHDLRWGHVLVTKSFTGTQLCELDRFQVTDWFSWPWYRRWPWDWSAWSTGQTCILGKFHPVAEHQVAEIEALLDD